MFMGGPLHMLRQETLKPQRVSVTLGRLSRYFRPYGLALLAVAVLVVVGTYAQVLTPALIGQAVDCYLLPSGGAASGGCWYAPGAGATGADQIRGLGGLILLVVGLFVVSSLAAGLQFFAMGWTGQHVMRRLRTDLFRHLHRLSLGYYSTHEVGGVMSRITNDMETLQQTLRLPLVSGRRGALLVIWIAVQMLRLSVPYALLSMIVLPLMLGVTLWLSSQARKAFRATRVEIGRVNADLEESISAVREMQAFGREEANIEGFR